MDVLSNLVTAPQLEAWMVSTAKTDRANQDQWCYALGAILGRPCPAYDVGNPPDVQTSATVFLEGLRNYELGFNASNQQPGGNAAQGVTAAAPQTAAAGMGVLGPTNCQFCIWARKNWIILLLAVVAIYFGFFYKK